MAFLSDKQRWILATGLAAGASALAVRVALPHLWHAATGDDPPVDPSSPTTSWTEALTWTVSASLVSGVAGLLARRGASGSLDHGKPADTFG